MRSAIAITDELDDAHEAARQLADMIRNSLQFKKYSIGLLACDAELDGATVTGDLQDLLGIAVAGVTTLATIDQDGYHNSAATLTVLTADDCTFSAAVSAPLTQENYKQAVVDAYRATVPEGSGPEYAPKLLFTFCSAGMPFSGDVYPEILAEAAGNAPIIGGVASDDYEYCKARLFLSGREYKESFLIVNVSGNAKPLFSMRHVTSRFAERIRPVTDARDNIVYTVGDETFVQYLEGFGLMTDVPDVLLAFNSYPMMLTRENGDEEIPLMRHITGLDRERGSGMCVGNVPLGAQVNICLVNKKDIITSCRESMRALLDMASAHKDHAYSAIFCATCSGRSLLLGADSDAEGRALAELLPEGLALSGAYCSGEFAPVRYKDGEALNKFHNCSIALCMI